MRMQRIRWTVGALALLGSLAIAGASHASCTGSNRLTIGESSCLDGSHTSSCSDRIFSACIAYSSTYWAQGRCKEKVVAKIDIAGGTDATWHLTNFLKKTGTSSKKVRGVYCCDDLGRCN